jgi:hypothetical protein
MANRKGEEKKKEKREAKKILKRASSAEEDEPRPTKKFRKTKPDNTRIQPGHPQQPAATSSSAYPTHQQFGYRPEIQQYSEYPTNYYGYAIPDQETNAQTQYGQYAQQPEVPHPFQQMPQELIPHDSQYDALDASFFVQPPLEEYNAFLDPAFVALDFNVVADEVLGQYEQHAESIHGDLNLGWSNAPVQDPNLWNDDALNQDENGAKLSDDLFLDKNELPTIALDEMELMNQAEAANSASINNDNIQQEAQQFVLANDNIPSQDGHADYPLADASAPQEEDDWASLDVDFNHYAPEIFGADPEIQQQPVADTPHGEDPVEDGNSDQQDAMANAEIDALFEPDLFDFPDHTQDAQQSDMDAPAEDEFDFSEYLDQDMSQFDMTFPEFDHAYVDLYSSD